MANTGEMITRVYGNFRGVDFRGEEINLMRSPDALNVWKDYKETDSIRTRPEMAWVSSSPDGKVNGIFFFKGEMLKHCGKHLYKVVEGQSTLIWAEMNDAISQSFVFEDVLYIKDGKNYLRYDGTAVSDVVGYVPTTYIDMEPAGAGKKEQDVNMIQPKMINHFISDGKSKEYFLHYKNIDTDFRPIVKSLDGQELSDYTVDYTAGKIIFDEAPDRPLTDGASNISIEFSYTNNAYLDAFLNTTQLIMFDNRVFFYGNKEYPNAILYSELDNPTFIGDTNLSNDGMDTVAIKGMVTANNALWAFSEPNDANTTIFYHTPTIDDTYGKVYPYSHSSVTTGCIGKAINFNDDIVFFSDRGMEGISGDITTEQVVEHRSTLVDRKLTAENDYANMVLAEWKGYLLVFIGNHVYLADSRTAFTNEDHIEYEWFYWELGRKVRCATVHDGELYMGTDDGVYTITTKHGGEEAVESYWVTPKDKFNNPHMQKTSNKRGCVAEATGDITVYAKVEDTDFQLIGEYKDVQDYFVSRIKRKKFKDIQLKFHSNKRLRLETVTLEAWIGGYIKR